jgi:hypothetical protein
MKNKHIEQFLQKYYATDKDIYPYAVLIKGIWGIGKTTFIRKSTERLSEINKKEIYISLFGISSTEQINYKIIELFNTKLTSKSAKALGAIINSTWGTISNDEFRKLIKYVDEIKDNKGDKYVFIFDDFERSNLDIVEFLGYVDNLLCVKKCRVVIIFDEDKILLGSSSSKDSSEYKKYNEYEKYKEKVIGQTFEIDQDIDNILPILISEYHESLEYQKILKMNFDTIKNIYLKHGDFNLRTLKRSFYHFFNLFKKLEKQYQDNIGFMSKLLKRFVIYFIEYHNKLDFDFYPSYSSYIANYKNDKLIGKFPDLFPFDNFLTSKFWVTVIKENKIDTLEVNDHISKSSYFYNEKTEPWRKLVNYYNSEIEENYEDLFNAELSKFYDDKIEDILEFICFSELLLVLSMQEIIPSTGEELLKVALNNLDRLKKCGKFELYNNSKDEENQLGRINYIGSGCLKEFQDQIEEAKQEGREKFLYKESLGLVDLMTENTQLFFDNLVETNSTTAKFPYNISVMNNIDKVKFIENYLQIDDNKRSIVRAVLKQRIKSSQLTKEVKWIESLLETIVDKESREKLNIVRKIKLFELKNTIHTIIEKK